MYYSMHPAKELKPLEVERGVLIYYNNIDNIILLKLTLQPPFCMEQLAWFEHKFLIRE